MPKHTGMDNTQQHTPNTPQKPSNALVDLYNQFLYLIHRLLFDLKKNIILLLVCIAVIIGALFIYNTRKSNVYMTTFTVSYEELVRKIYGDRINKLNELVVKENITTLQTLLGTTKEQTETLAGLAGQNILGEDLSKDLNTDRIPFTVIIYLNDTTYVNELQNGVMSFLEDGSPYLSDKKRLKIQEIDQELIFIDQQLSMMDSLKSKYNTANATPTKENTGISDIYQFSYELYKRKQELIKKKEMPSNLNVIDDALVPRKAGRSPIIIVAAGIILGFMVYFALVYILIPAIRIKE